MLQHACSGTDRLVGEQVRWRHGGRRLRPGAAGRVQARGALPRLVTVLWYERVGLLA